MGFDESLKAAFRERANTLTNVDTDVYETFGKDPLEPIIGLGEADCRVAFFGRDPGKEEVRHGFPFIGAGGQKVRGALYQHLYGADMPDFDASVEVGKRFFWANTVPYKPIGNKAWSMSVKKTFQPLMAGVLLNSWRGADVITLGREAFLWFGINQPKQVRDALETFWKRVDRFETVLETPLEDGNGGSRTLRLHPLPHPSPLNATWYKRFPELLRNRLANLSVTPQTLAI